MQSADPNLEAEPTCKDDAAFWLYSSGKHGSSQGCIHLHHDMVVSSELYARGILQMNENDRCYSVARLFFAYGLGKCRLFPIALRRDHDSLPDTARPRDDLCRHRASSAYVLFLSSHELCRDVGPST